MGARFWLRWSWRDLRRRGAEVVAIAMIVALGTGLSVALGSMSEWRRLSVDASLERLAAHDVEIELLFGAAPPAALTDAVAEAAGEQVAQVETRTLVDGPLLAADATVVAAGTLVGVDLVVDFGVDRAGGPRLDRWKITDGRSLTADDRDAGRDEVLLDARFAGAHDVRPGDTVRFAGRDLEVVGLALSPEHINLNTTAGESILGAASRAIVFGPIELVQEIAGTPGLVNDVVLAAAPGVDPRALATELGASLPTVLTTAGAGAPPMTVTALADDPAVHAIRDEIASERRLFDVFTVLVLVGAGFAVFNLVRRVVEGQRRDIGVAMSLGVPVRTIAIRPLLLAAGIAVLGAMLGLVSGLALARVVMAITRATAPLPYWVTPFQAGEFARAAALGVLIPFVAAAQPVWRAVRVQPVDALVPPHLRHRRARLLAAGRRARLPGSTLVQAPFGRILRAPSRSLLTIAAVAVVVAPLLTALGATDSASATLDRGRAALAGESGERIFVGLTGFQPATAPTFTALASHPLVDRVAPTLDLGGVLRRDGSEVQISLSMVDLGDGLSAPASIAEQRIPPGGIVISAKAADDLGVDVGDDVALVHPHRDGLAYTFVETTLPVTALHDSPYRFVAYMDLADASLMGLGGLANAAKVAPLPGHTTSEVVVGLSEVPGLAYVLSSDASAITMESMLEVITELFVVLQLVIALLVFLVAFNTAGIGADERAREHATMFAFGIGERRVLAIGVAESVLLGIVAVATGLGLGRLILRWVLATVVPAAVPDLTIPESVAPGSYVVTIVIGLAAVAVAPLFNLRRLRRMGIASTLRYVE